MTGEIRMSIVPARARVRSAPEDVEALTIRVREPQGPVRRLGAVGDVVPAEHVIGDGDPFREVSGVLSVPDLTFANLEAPLLPEIGPETETQLGDRKTRFVAPLRAAELLASAGFGILNLANNHIADFGGEGLAETRRTVTACGLKTLGAGPSPEAARGLEITDLGGLSLGWLGSARTLEAQEPRGDVFRGDVFWEWDPDEMTAAVRDARPRVDVLIASLHMGYMFVDYPHPEQRQQALALLDAGADLVLLHHAHVLQGIEVTDGGMICHNLGNFLLDWTLGHIRFENMQEEQRTGGIFVFDLDAGGVCQLSVLPVRVDDEWTVRWARGETGRAILERLERISQGWGAATDREFHRQLADRTTGLAVRSTLMELRHGGLTVVPGLLRRVKGHHLRMIVTWPAQKLIRWLRALATA